MSQIVGILAIAGIVFLEFRALQLGINGKVLAIAVTLIAGIGGFEIGKFTKNRRTHE